MRPFGAGRQNHCAVSPPLRQALWCKRDPFFDLGQRLDLFIDNIENGEHVSIGELGSLGELIAALATLATLIYLALQIRQNTAVHKTQSLRYIIDGQLAAYESFSANDTERDIFKRGCRSYYDLSGDEKIRFGIMLAKYFTTCEYAFTSYKDKLIKAEAFKSTERQVLYLMRQPGVIEYWNKEKWNYAEDFQREVDNLLENQSP